MNMSMRHSSSYVWSVTELIGQGATGNVFICRSKKNGKAYAAKVFNSMGQMRNSIVRTREIELSKKLVHRNVVTLVAEEREMSTKSTVLIMELCETSLYHVLEYPENYYGLSETEFKSVLRDVVHGMKYLRENNVVHRDVKPGNILLTKSPTGRSVYKLSDFGAARQLQDADQSFISIYGTEEYLHPDVYERAIMKNFDKKKFTATVDLWSMGVTFYHAATGQLPFRPYGGRQNKETMFEIISKKAPKIISGVQKANGGPIEYSNDLPDETRISKGLKNLLRPIFQELLETSGEGLEKIITFDQLYVKVEEIAAMKVIDVFCTSTSTWHKIYMKEEDSLIELQVAIAKQTGVKTKDQLLFLSSERLKPSEFRRVNSLPVIDKENPLVVVGVDENECTDLYQRRIPPLPKIPGGRSRTEGDIDVLKLYSSICCVYEFSAEDVYFSLRATYQVFETMKNLLNNIVESIADLSHNINGQRQLADHIEFIAYEELNQIKRIWQKVIHNGAQDNLKGNTPSEHHCDEEQSLNVKSVLEEASAACSYERSETLPIEPLSNAKECLDEVKILSHSVNEIYSHIAKGKPIGQMGMNLDELIYTAKKQQITESFEKIVNTFGCLAEARRQCHVEFNSWQRRIGLKLVEYSHIEASLKRSISSDSYSKKMDSISTQKKAMLDDLENFLESNANGKPGRSHTSNTSLSVMEKEVSSLESLLHEIVALVDEGDKKLLSSREIVEKLSQSNSQTLQNSA